jgi:hypothetical protein
MGGPSGDCGYGSAPSALSHLLFGFSYSRELTDRLVTAVQGPNGKTNGKISGIKGLGDLQRSCLRHLTLAQYHWIVFNSSSISPVHLKKEFPISSLPFKMIYATLSSVSVLAILSLASAAPTATTPVYPPKTTSQNFRLVANVTANDLSPSINNFVLSSYHVGAGEDYAVLVANESATAGRIFYVNGTASDVFYQSSNILSDEGTPLFPAGISVDAAGANGEEALSINAGEGQAGIILTQFPDPISELDVVGGAGFYACSNNLPFGPAVQVFSNVQGQTTPAGCADITLLPQCSEGSGLAHPFGQIANCYADVAGIDWTVYSSD